MELGAVYFFTDTGPDPVEFARTVEGSGFDSLFLPEHSHFPVTRTTPYPAVYGGGRLPDYYVHTLDQIVTLSMIAASTRTLRLGTGICLLAQHDAIWKAKELATLDLLSGGRLICGVGFGWNRDEAEDHGVVWPDRFEIIRDKVALMRSLWTQEEAAFEGEHAVLPPSWAWPKPKQPGGPKIYLGGTGPTTMRHAAEWADTWYVVPPPDDPLLERLLPAFRRIVDEVGRDPATLGVAVASAPPDPRVLEHYLEEGVELAALWVEPADSPDEGMRNLQAVAKVLADFRA
jgi:probable F420-dependent oxidoreductase